MFTQHSHDYASLGSFIPCAMFYYSFGLPRMSFSPGVREMLVGELSVHDPITIDSAQESTALRDAAISSRARHVSSSSSVDRLGRLSAHLCPLFG